MNKILLVYNVHSGRINEKIISRVNRQLIENGFITKFYRTEKIGETYRIIKRFVQEKIPKGGIDFIAVLGGDGIINEAANALAYTNIPLGIIPFGTGNSFAKDNSIPLSIKGSIKLFNSSNIKVVDLGKIEFDKSYKYFIMMCSCGFDVKALSEISINIKRRLKIFTYIYYGIRAFLFYKPVKLNVRVEEENLSCEGYFCIISNIKSYGDPLVKIAPSASIDDGLLDICVFRSKEKLSFLRYVIGVFVKKHVIFKDVVYFQTKNEVKIDIDNQERKESINPKVQLDGDVIASIPVKVKVAPKALRIFLP